jgi:hypothetical protein
MANHEGELELELEHEFHEGEMEGEAGLEGEGWLGAIGNVVGSLLGESEGELHELHELEGEGELHELPELEGEGELHELHEGEAGLEGEGWLGAIGNVVGSLLGEQEFEGELESEHFFKGIGRFLKRAAPILKKVAKVAAPIVGTAIGGPVGGLLGKAAGSLLGEGELEHELHESHELHEFESEFESEFEGETEMAHEIASHELTHHEALAEMMAEAASHEQHEGEAEAMVGAATLTVISPADRRALRRILPHLVRGAAILTRILRRRRVTRPMVRAVPTIVRRTVRDLKKQAAKGIPVTRRTAARAAARQVRRVLGSPKACTVAVVRNIRTSRAYKRPTRSRAARG